MRIAVVQMEPAWKDEVANLAQVDRWLGELADQDVGLAVFPECALSGYELSAAEAAHFAHPIPGPQSEALVDLARRHRRTFQIGLLELAPSGEIYNSCILVSPHGLLGSYRKTHLPFLGVDRYLQPGGRIGPVLDTGLARIGPLICYDLRFPEPARVLALLGAQVVLLSTAWPDSATLYPEFLAPTRAAENGVFLAAANRIGREGGTKYLGRSLIIDPAGTILAEGSEDQAELLIADVDLSASDEKRRIFVPGEYELDLLGDRRPELYHTLTERNVP
jgi:predicted amidohydrolase